MKNLLAKIRHWSSMRKFKKRLTKLLNSVDYSVGPSYDYRGRTDVLFGSKSKWYAGRASLEKKEEDKMTRRQLIELLEQFISIPIEELKQ